MSNISILIKKVDIYSTVNTTIEYYDSNNKYIVYKDTNELFLNDIFTFHKTNDTYKTEIINKSHKFYNAFTLDSYHTVSNTFRIKIANVKSGDKNSDIFPFNSRVVENISGVDTIVKEGDLVKLRNSTNPLDPNWCDDPQLVSTQPNSGFSIDQTYIIKFTENAGNNLEVYKSVELHKDLHITGNPTPSTVDSASHRVTFTNSELLIVSNPFKKIPNDPNTEILNLSNISNVKISINVTSEDRQVKNTYVYVISI